MRTLLLGVALALSCTWADAQVSRAGYAVAQRLEKNAADLNERVQSGQITRERACEVLADSLPIETREGSVLHLLWWSDKSADPPPDAMFEGVRYGPIYVPLACPGKEVRVLLRYEGPKPSSADRRSMGASDYIAMVGIPLFLITAVVGLVYAVLIWRRGKPLDLEIKRDGVYAEAGAKLGIASESEVLLSTALSERNALIEQLRAQMGALESQVQRMRKERNLT